MHHDGLAGSNPKWQVILKDALGSQSWPGPLKSIASKLANGTPLSVEDGLALYQHSSLHDVGRLANEVRLARFGRRTFFNANVHVNQTNVCVLACKFCAFRRGPKSKDAYAMSIEAYIEDVGKYAAHVDEVHSVGGLHPDWDVEHYVSMFEGVRANHPSLSIKALTAVEIKHLGQLSNITTKAVLQRLKEAGLTSLPGGGAEILDDEVRANICNGKESSEEYLRIHKEAHEVGLPSNCTMLFGTVETLKQRLEHMVSLRNLQASTLGFQCFVPYPYLPDASRLPEAQLATAAEVVRTIAVSRLMLNNIPHIKAYRMNIGDHVAELALQYGADDIDGTVQKESIMHLAGSTAPLDHDRNNLARLIEDAGGEPVQRNTTYTHFTPYTPVQVPHRKSLPMAS